MARIESFKDLIVYQKTYKLAMMIFELTNSFPKEEKYSRFYAIRYTLSAIPHSPTPSPPYKSSISQ